MGRRRNRKRRERRKERQMEREAGFQRRIQARTYSGASALERKRRNGDHVVIRPARGDWSVTWRFSGVAVPMEELTEEGLTRAAAQTVLLHQKLEDEESSSGPN